MRRRTGTIKEREMRLFRGRSPNWCDGE